MSTAPAPRDAPLVALAAALLLLAALLGASLSLHGAPRVALALAALLPLPLIFRDYRVGALLLTLLLPIAPMLPPIRGLNLLNFVTAATLAALLSRRVFLAQASVALPRSLWLGLVLPATWAMALAWPHLAEGPRNYPRLADAEALFAPGAYLVSHYLKPLGYYLAYAYVLAQAVRDSRQPERFIAALALSALGPALAVFYTVAQYPGSLLDVSRDREFMAPRGMHANEFGMLLASAAAPLLFVAPRLARRRWRWATWAVWGLLSVALLLTFSRGALLAALIAGGGYLLHQRRLLRLLPGTALLGLLVLAAPASMTERFGAGLRDGAIQDASQVEKDALTAGRLHGWLLLAPEVLENPLLGRGLGATQWSAAVARGAYQANHPHNIYLEVLMDTGLLGLALMAWLYTGHLRRFGRLARDPAQGAPLQGFFLGARYGLLGLLVMAATTAYYMPNSAQAYLWFTLGLAFSQGPLLQHRSAPPGRETARSLPTL